MSKLTCTCGTPLKRIPKHQTFKAIRAQQGKLYKLKCPKCGKTKQGFDTLVPAYQRQDKTSSGLLLANGGVACNAEGSFMGDPVFCCLEHNHDIGKESREHKSPEGVYWEGDVRRDKKLNQPTTNTQKKECSTCHVWSPSGPNDHNQNGWCHLTGLRTAPTHTTCGRWQARKGVGTAHGGPLNLKPGTGVGERYSPQDGPHSRFTPNGDHQDQIRRYEARNKAPKTEEKPSDTFGDVNNVAGKPLQCDVPGCSTTHKTKLVGDPETLGWTCNAHRDTEFCRVRLRGNVVCCTRGPFHRGDHVAWGIDTDKNEFIAYQWSRDDC